MFDSTKRWHAIDTTEDGHISSEDIIREVENYFGCKYLTMDYDHWDKSYPYLLIGFHETDPLNYRITGAKASYFKYTSSKYNIIPFGEILYDRLLSKDLKKKNETFNYRKESI